MTRWFYIYSYLALTAVGSVLLVRNPLQSIGLYILLQAVGILADGITDKLLSHQAAEETRLRNRLEAQRVQVEKRLAEAWAVIPNQKES